MGTVSTIGAPATSARLSNGLRFITGGGAVRGHRRAPHTPPRHLPSLKLVRLRRAMSFGVGKTDVE